MCFDKKYDFQFTNNNKVIKSNNLRLIIRIIKIS